MTLTKYRASGIIDSLKTEDKRKARQYETV